MKWFKQYFAFTMVFFLIFSNIGLALNVHYCGGQIDKITLGYPESHTADACVVMKEVVHSCCAKKNASHHEPVKKKSCCEDETFKQNNDKVVVKAFKVQHDVFVPYVFKPIVYIPTTTIVKQKQSVVAFYSQTNAPPLYKLYHQFLFYA